MKTIAALLLASTAMGCHNEKIDGPRKYVRVYEALRQDSCFKAFVGYQIIQIPREKDYYEVTLNKPMLTIYAAYTEDKGIKVVRTGMTELRDSLLNYGQNTGEKEQQRIVEEIGALISIMTHNSIESAQRWHLSASSDSSYFIDFRLSKDEILRYFSQRAKVSFPTGTNVTRIDTSWYYVAQPHAQ